MGIVGGLATLAIAALVVAQVDDAEWKGQFTATATQIGKTLSRLETSLEDVDSKLDGISEWRAAVDVALAQKDRIANDAAAAIDVAKQHGQEFNQVRTEIAALRGAIESLRQEMIERAADRFKGADWRREEEILRMKFGAIEKRLDSLENGGGQ